MTQQYTKGDRTDTTSFQRSLAISSTWRNGIQRHAHAGIPGKTEGNRQKERRVICGEAHICVLQTTLQLMEEGYNVYLVVDCIDSVNENDKLWGISRMGEAGAVITYESVLYEILQDSKADGFKAISAIVKIRPYRTGEKVCIFENEITLKSADPDEYMNSYEYKTSGLSFSSMYMWRNINLFQWDIIGDYMCVTGLSHLELEDGISLPFLFPPLHQTEHMRS